MTRLHADLKRWLRNVSLQRKLLCTYLIVLIIPVSIFVIYAAFSSRNFVRENAEQVLRGMVEQANKAFQLKIDQYNQSIGLCVYQEDLQRVYHNRYNSYYDLYIGLTQTADPFLQGVVSGYSGEIYELLIYCQNGLRTYGTFIRPSEGVQDEPWYKQAISKSGITRTIKNDELFATCRIDPISRLYGSEPLGVLYFSLKLSDFLERYIEINWDTYRLVICDASGEVIYDHVYGDESLFADSADTLEYSYVWESQGWVFRYSIPDGTVLGFGNGIFVLTAAILATSTFMLIVLIVLFTRLLLRRLWKLRDNMLIAKSGGLDIKIDRGARDEIGILTDTFADMLENIQTLIREVKDAQRQKSDAEIQLLRAQIDPHFLYNSLSYVNWKALRSGQDDISFIVGQLATFYRTCLNCGHELTTVCDELRNICAYIDIQLVTHDRSFDVEYHIQGDMKEQRMLNFLLQPLVENAILHGAGKTAEARGRIVVSAARDGSRLIFTIEDNGPGLSEAVLSTILAQSKPGHGYGVYNVLNRIRLYYGEEYGISLANRPGGGLVATVYISEISLA